MVDRPTGCNFAGVDCPNCGTRFRFHEREDRRPALPDVDERYASGSSFAYLRKKRSAGEFDVFLCHNSVDKAAVKTIGQRLMDRGILPWLDEWELRPGLPWQRLLEEQIERVAAVAVFAGENGIGPWQDREQDAFLREYVRRNCPVIPVILPGATSTPKLPLLLAGMTWVDFRRHEPDPVDRLIWGITGERPPLGC